MEQGVPREYRLVVAVLHKIADAILSMARGVEGLDVDAANLELLPVSRGPGHLLAVFASDDLGGCPSKVGYLCDIVSIKIQLIS